MNSIFISSSFKDMQYERDMLRYKALPQINDYLRTNYGQETTIIDLRWGIDTTTDDERTSMNKIIRTCLYEIDNCKPFMIVLFGDRYGTLIEKEQFGKYVSDFNADVYDNIGVTELEIRYAMHLADAGKMNLFFYFRDMDYSNISDEDKLSIYLDSEEVLLKREKLETLKNEIKEKYPDCCRTYKASWNNKTNKIEGLDKLSDYIFEDIKKCIVNELGASQKSPMCVDDAFIKSKQESFVGREEEFSQIDNFIKSEEYDIAVVRGSVGVGKSALMANIPKVLNNDAVEYISVFCGQSDSSDTALGIIRNIVYRMRLLLNEVGDNEDETTWSADRWHQEMDKLIDTYLKNSSNKLVILIDAIDQIVQDVQTQKLYYLPYTHGGKVKVVLSAVTEHKIETFLPSLEHMTTIGIQEPTEQEINKVIDEVWLKYGKPSVSNEIKKELREKSLSNNYLYINLLLNRLTYIGLEVFSDKNNSEQHIIENISRIISSFPDTLEGAAEELLNVLGGYINSDLANEVFAFLCLSENGLRLTDIQTLCAEKYDASDFSYIKKLIGNFLFERGDHRLDFTHKIFRGIGINNVNSNYVDRYFKYASSLNEDDSLAIPFCIHSANKAKKYVDLHRFIKNWIHSPSLSVLAGEKLASMFEDDESMVNDFIQSIPCNNDLWNSLSFVTNCLLPFAPVSRTTKELVDKISDLIFNEYNVEDLELENLKLLSKFEERRFNLEYKYSGGNQCETDRYLCCLKKIARKEPSFDNRVAVANFRLDYDEYWDSIFEKYIFNADKEDRKDRINSTANEILKEFEHRSEIDSLLLCAKAYVKKADAEYAELITFKQERAESFISKARGLLNQASYMATESPLQPSRKFKSQRNCIVKTAEVYYLIGRIYMRVTDRCGLDAECFRHCMYMDAANFLDQARELFELAGSVNHYKYVLIDLLNVLLIECELLEKRTYIEDETVEKICNTVSNLLEHLEKNIYIFAQSQQLCVQYGDLCKAKSIVVSNTIPILTHISEKELYPWSTVYTWEENYKLYETIREMNYWYNKSVLLAKYLFISYPTPGNTERFIDILKNRIINLNTYKYRSLDTIKSAKEKPWEVENSAIERDKALHEKQKLPFLLDLCEALGHRNVSDNEIFMGLYLLVAFRIYNKRYFSEYKNVLLKQESTVCKIEKRLFHYVEHALEDTESFAYYILNHYQTHFFEFDSMLFCDEKQKSLTKHKCQKALKDNPKYSHRYCDVYYEWDIICNP